MRYFPHIPRTVRTGTYSSTTHPSRSSRCPELASSYYLCHYRPTSACFCHRLYTSARRSSRSSRSACSACSACSAAPASQPARRLLCLLCLLPAACSSLLCRSSQPACKKSETLKSLAFLLSGLGLRQPPPHFLRVSPENLPGRAARGSWPNRPRGVSLRR